MPTGGYNILCDDRAVLVGSLISGFLLNFGKIIANEIKIRAIRTDNEVKEMKTHNFDRRDKSRPTLSLGKGASFGDDTPTIEGTQTLTCVSRSVQSIQILLEKYFHATSYTVPKPEMKEPAVITAFVLEYAIIPQNFNKMVKQGNRFYSQLKRNNLSHLLRKTQRNYGALCKSPWAY